MDGKESTTPQKPRFFVSKAPPPINPVGPTVRLSRPKPLQMPIHLPPDYPDELKQLTRKIIVEAIKEFPVDTQITRQTQITKVCKRVVSKLTPKLCAVVGDEVLSVMDKLLHYFLDVNCGELERDQVRQETIESGEWTNLTKEMVRVPLAGRPQSQPGETTGHKDAKHAEQPESKKRGPKGFEGLDKSQKSRTYSDMLASAGLTKMQFDCASLAWEHGLLVKEVAARVRRHRRTVHGHLQNVTRKIQMARLKEGSAKKEAKTKPGSLEPGSID